MVEPNSNAAAPSSVVYMPFVLKLYYILMLNHLSWMIANDL